MGVPMQIISHPFIAVAMLTVSVAVLLWTVWRLQNRVRYLEAALAQTDGLVSAAVDGLHGLAEQTNRAIGVLSDGVVQHHQRIEHLETGRAMAAYRINGPAC